MAKENLIFAMRITKLAADDYYIDYPFNGMNISGGAESLHEAIDMATESLEFTLFDLYENGESFPVLDEKELSELEQAKKENEYISLISTNMNNILEKFGNEPVKKMISIKQYQDFYLKKKHISLSKYVQEAIEKDLQEA